MTDSAALAERAALEQEVAGRTLCDELAADTGLTLVGFLRGGSMNVYTGEHRVAAAGG